MLKFFIPAWVLLSISSFVFAGSLEDYLANPPKIENPLWGEMTPPHESIPVCLRLYKEAQTDRDRGLAIGGLAFVARLMIMHPESRDAATDIFVRWVVPNIAFTRSVDKTESCSWKNTIIRVVESYKISGNSEGEKAALELLYDGAEDEDTEEMAIYLIAYHQANTGDFDTAIKTIEFLPSSSKWANERANMVKNWTKKKQIERENAKKKPKP
jgi:hypothetical protein